MVSITAATWRRQSARAASRSGSGDDDAVNSAMQTTRDYTSNAPGSKAALKGDYALTSLVSRLLTGVAGAVGSDGSPKKVGLELSKDGKTVTFTKSAFVDALNKQGFTPAEIGTHAGLNDTALTLAVDKSLVRADVLARGTDLDRAHGVYGDPRRATAEVGQAGVQQIVEISVAAIQRAAASKR